MNEFFLKHIDRNLSIIVYIMMLTKQRYDLFFQMLGGESEGNYKEMRRIKQYFEQVGREGTFGGMHAVLNPDNTLAKNHYLVAISLILNIPVEFIRKNINQTEPWLTDNNWLKRVFTKEQIKDINTEIKLWKQKMTTKSKAH